VTLPVVENELVACVACGLCLPHCPTYRVTGREIASPRGRIAAMRAVQFGGAPMDAAFAAAMEECVQCRGCEAACPSGVPFGHLMEGARAALATQHHHRSRLRRVAEWLAYVVVLPRHGLLVALTYFLLVGQRLHLVPKRLGLPPLSLRSIRQPLRSGGQGEPVWLFPGCVMDAWLRDTHRAAQRVMERADARVQVPARGADCCGALHIHAGRVDEAKRLALRTMASMPGDAPIVVDSAGCAAAMKDYGRLVGSDEARQFAARVRDFSEWLVGHGQPAVARTDRSVVVQDPCHLRHVQRQTAPVRDALGAAYTLLETGDEGLCCGAGGAYGVLQPELSNAIRARKVAALEAVGGAGCVVASANPGCLLHLRAAGVDARHPAELLAEVLDD